MLAALKQDISQI